MPILKVVSIRDAKSISFDSQLHCVPTVDVAIRDLRTVVNSGKGNMSEYPEDYDLYEIGVFDTEDGAFEPTYPVHHVLNLKSLKQTVA